MIRSQRDRNLNLSDHHAETITKLIELWDEISDQQQGTNTNFKVCQPLHQCLITTTVPSCSVCYCSPAAELCNSNCSLNNA